MAATWMKITDENYQEICKRIRDLQAENADLRRQLEELRKPVPIKEGPCVHIHRAFDGQCFDCGAQTT